MSTPKREGGVQSVGKALDVLETVAHAGGELALSDITAATGQPMPTVHRLVRTMVDRGYLRQLPNRRYALGTQLIPMGHAARTSFGNWSRPILTELVDEFHETVNLAVLDGDDVVYIGQSPSPHAMRMFTEIGRRVKPHSTGVGKALLTQLPDDAVQALLRRTGMPPMTPTTITSPEELLTELAAARERGYALDEGEMEVGVRCVALPIPETAMHMAVSMSGPQMRMTDELIQRALPALRQAGEQIAEEFRSAP